MDEDLLAELPAITRDRIRVAQDEIEQWFDDTITKANALEDVTLGDLEDIHRSYFVQRGNCFAQEIWNAGREMKWSAAQIRETIDAALKVEPKRRRFDVDRFGHKIPYLRSEAESETAKPRNTGPSAEFTRYFEVLQRSPEWRDLQENLENLEAWQAQHGTESTPPLTDKLAKDALGDTSADADSPKPAQAGGTAPKAEEPTPTQASIVTDRSNESESVAADRAARLTAYKAKGRDLGIRITDTMVAKAANPEKWNDRTMVTWWKRNDPKCKSPHDRKISAVLDRDPASVWPLK